MIKGECRHKDDKGNDNIATAGQVQHFWCGPSMYHHLSNESQCDNRYLQIWIMPDLLNRDPMTYELINREPGFAKLPINFKNSKVQVWAGELEDELILDTYSYMLVLEGSCKANGIQINEGDAIDVDSFTTVIPDGKTHIILFELH